MIDRKVRGLQTKIGLAVYFCALAIFVPLIAITAVRCLQIPEFALIGSNGVSLVTQKCGLTADELTNRTYATIAQNFIQNVAEKKGLIEVITNVSYSIGGLPLAVNVNRHLNTSALDQELTELATQFVAPFVINFYFQISQSLVVDQGNNSAQNELKYKIQEDLKSLLTSNFSNLRDYQNALYAKFIDLSLQPILTLRDNRKARQYLNSIKTEDASENSRMLIAMGFGSAYLDAVHDSGCRLDDISAILNLVSFTYYQELMKTAVRGLYPVIIIAMLIISTYACLCICFRNEPEIRARHHQYTLQVYLCSFLACLSIFGMMSGEDILVFTSCALSVFFLCGFFSAINLRHRFMYYVFVKPKTYGSKQGIYIGNLYWFPLLWHVPIAVAAAALTYIVSDAGICTHVFKIISFGHLAGIGLGCILIFCLESVFYIYQLRHKWESYVDFYFNIRIFAFFVTIIVIVIIVLCIVPYSYQYFFVVCMVTLYIVLTVCTYILDSFTTPLLKVLFRRRNFSVWEDLNFEAQDIQIDDLDDVIKDERLCERLLSVSRDHYCQENVLFLMEVDRLDYACSSHNLRYENVETVKNRFFESNSEYELNVVAKTRKNFLSMCETFERDDLITRDSFIKLFNVPCLEVGDIVKENLFAKFLESLNATNIQVKDNFSLGNDSGVIKGRKMSSSIPEANVVVVLNKTSVSETSPKS